VGGAGVDSADITRWIVSRSSCRRARHTLKGRQDAQAVAATREQLKALKAQAEAGELELLFADEAEVSTHPYLARTWARRGETLRVEAPGKAVLCLN
jgi:hypothetical protein